VSEGLFDFIAHHRPIIDDALAERLPLSSQFGAERLNEALEYAVFPGGKRLRPVLTLLGARVVGGSIEQALSAACAVEFLHTSSLILDDLPAMDDARLRRNRAALHLVYGEAVATLAALALLNRAYALFARPTATAGSAVARLVVEATRAVGEEGMIGGQAADLGPGVEGGRQGALASRSLKTTALMRLTMSAGAIACEACEADISALAEFGEHLGAAYQVRDDLLDELGDSSLTGKTIKQDARHLRRSFVAELGVEGANHMAMGLIEQGKSAITGRFGDRLEARLLVEAADIIAGGVDIIKTLSHTVV
jgi:geranylgeranyl diphosphate synthase type II